jgi:hypothetical protein
VAVLIMSEYDGPTHWESGVPVWERHRGAYAPPNIAGNSRDYADPAPAGLTAAQQIRLSLAVAWLTGTADAGEEARQVVLRWAEMCEHGPDVRANPEARPIPRQTTCPDPALHDADLREAERVAAIRDLKTELLETHADLEASRAREQIAQGRVAQVLAYVDRSRAGVNHASATAIRAILTGDQGEEA